MNKLISNIADLIKVKTLVTLIVIIVFAVIILRSNVTLTGENLIVIVTTVIAFYFGTQHETNINKGE